MTMLPRPQALLLDLDGTILDHESASRAAILASMESSGLLYQEDPEASLVRWRDLEAKYFQKYLDGELDFEEQRVVRMQEFVKSHGRADADRRKLLRWFDYYLAAYERAWRPFDDVYPFLNGVATLDDEPVLAVVTNGDQSQQAAKLTSLGLECIGLYTSSTIGSRKPDRAIFIEVCETIGVEPAEAWFVGDNREVDALGAQRAGLQGIWLDRHSSLVRRGRPSRASTLMDVLTWIQESR